MSSTARQGRLSSVPSRTDSTLKKERYLSVAEAAERMGLPNERFPRRLVAERRITFVKFGTHVRIPESALNEYIEANTIPAARVRRRSRGAA